MKRMDWSQHGRMYNTNYNTGTYTHYGLLLSLPGIDTNELNNIPS